MRNNQVSQKNKCPGQDDFNSGIYQAFKDEYLFLANASKNLGRGNTTKHMRPIPLWCENQKIKQNTKNFKEQFPWWTQMQTP